MKLKHLMLLSTAFIFSQQASAVGEDNTDRWFEVEVILFSQLGDKALLKENFPDNTALPEYRNIIDLLGPYLNPDITSLKQLLPSCDTPVYAESFIDQAITTIKAQPYFAVKSLADFTAITDQSINNTSSSTPISHFSDGSDKANEAQNSKPVANTEDDFYAKNSLLIEQRISSEADPLISHNALEVIDQPPIFSAKELAERTELLEKAATEFSAIQLNYADEIASFSQAICTITPEQFNKFNQSKSGHVYESYTAFTISNVPSTIDNNENIYLDQDYLLSEASLQLDDIVQEIARSRNFKPLMHFGWRQKTKTKQLAIPLKVFAGENFSVHYQQELQQFQHQLKQAQTQEALLHKALYKQSSPLIGLSEEALQQKLVKERLQELMVKLPSLPVEKSNLLTEIDTDIDNTRSMLNSTNMQIAPIHPPQDWTIEGFLKVEVDFYLHITADFNVMNMSLAEQATQKLLPGSKKQQSAQLKTINFKQDRRVRSTEIHYFDHPYMGIIIRILPYQKPTKEVEESASLH
ncbi:MAG: hypothetical protein ACI9N3_000211 [Colwellia sp.]|jgi:hypothetical protein